MTGYRSGCASGSSVAIDSGLGGTVATKASGGLGPSRLEGGSRAPTRDAIGKLARGLDLDRERTEALLFAAGLLPDTIDADELRRAVALVREVAARALDAAERRPLPDIGGEGGK